MKPAEALKWTARRIIFSKYGRNLGKETQDQIWDEATWNLWFSYLKFLKSETKTSLLFSSFHYAPISMEW